MIECEPSTGTCYGCRHVDDPRFSTSGHCHGIGDLESEGRWPGFICTCYCASLAQLDKAIEETW